MTRIDAVVQEIGLIDDLPAMQYYGRLECKSPVHFSPGQYFLANSLDLIEILPTVLFPRDWRNDELWIAPPFPLVWSAGMRLTLHGPLGHGFNLPKEVRRVALASMDDRFHRLMPLIQQVLSQKADVAIYTDTTPHDLSPAIEVLPRELLPEALTWANYLALDVPHPLIAGLKNSLGIKLDQQTACEIEVLVRKDMPCGGSADCCICSVKTRSPHSWKLACKDGPVFNLNNLEEE